MSSTLVRNVLAGAIVLTLAIPGWAAEETKSAPTKEEKAEKTEKKAVTKGSDEVKKIQEALKDKGQDPGTIDGIMGKKTREAIRAFQKSNDLKVTGRIDKETADKLGVEMPAKSSAKKAMSKKEKTEKTKEKKEETK